MTFDELLIDQLRTAEAHITPDIQRVGRWTYEVRLHIKPTGNEPWNWMMSLTTEPPSLVLGKRWARWKVRRMMAAEMHQRAVATGPACRES